MKCVYCLASPAEASGCCDACMAGRVVPAASAGQRRAIARILTDRSAAGSRGSGPAIEADNAPLVAYVAAGPAAGPLREAS